MLSNIWVWDPGSGKNLFRIPDPGVKKHRIPDPGSATLDTCPPLLVQDDQIYVIFRSVLIRNEEQRLILTSGTG
jgi:hypothetical protein